MNDYVVPKEVIEWAKTGAVAEQYTDFDEGYSAALEDFLTMINVVYTKDTE